MDGDVIFKSEYAPFALWDASLKGQLKGVWEGLIATLLQVNGPFLNEAASDLILDLKPFIRNHASTAQPPALPTYERIYRKLNYK